MACSACEDVGVSEAAVCAGQMWVRKSSNHMIVIIASAGEHLWRVDPVLSEPVTMTEAQLLADYILVPPT